MLTDVIKTDTANAFLSWLTTAVTQQNAVSILHFRFSEVPLQPTENALLTLLVPVLDGRKASLFLFDDGDMLLVWSGVQASVLEKICEALYRGFDLPPLPKRHHYYDLRAHAEQLRFLCHEKRGDISTMFVSKFEFATPNRPLPEPTEIQRLQFAQAAVLRPTREKLEILVVEDQLFSRSLLLGLLARAYKTFSAADAASAFALHLLQAPDILLLDIELPDTDGHTLAQAIRAFDPDVFIIMVTANNQLEDVRRARENGAKGFVVKPYSKQKIMDAIHAFTPPARH